MATKTGQSRHTERWHDSDVAEGPRRSLCLKSVSTPELSYYFYDAAFLGGRMGVNLQSTSYEAHQKFNAQRVVASLSSPVNQRR